MVNKDVYIIVSPIGVKFCTMVHIGPAHKVSSFGGAIPNQPQMEAKDGIFLAILTYQKAT